MGALGTDAITLSKYATEVCQVVTGVLFPIVDVEQQLISQCTINSRELASFKLWILAQKSLLCSYLCVSMYVISMAVTFCFVQIQVNFLRV